MGTVSALPTPDSYVWRLGPALSEAGVDGRHVRVRWSDGRTSVFHAMWLRDNCPCDQCVHPVTRE
ncbi:MAG: DUF971 domain-containing protein [Gammaproteobacteria bacterium]|nr:DUF971 domain-containing protein [Gammaproteobacteria bacterium]MYJ52921.1 DUF971 domain-containing protein [Gammaproteobacteria bacterium]